MGLIFTMDKEPDKISWYTNCTIRIFQFKLLLHFTEVHNLFVLKARK